MPSVKDVLKAAGMSDAEISSMDSKILGGFETVLTTATQAEQSAQQAREAAELARRAQESQYTTQIAPALDKWAIEQAEKDAQIAFYKTQAESARASGFIPKDAPGYVAPVNDPARAADGRYVPGPTGSPEFITAKDTVRAVSNVTWAMNEYQRLYNGALPDEFEQLLSESTERHLPFRDYVSTKYKFAEKKAEISAAAKEKERQAIRDEAFKERDKEWAERGGNNPAIRTAGPSQFAELRKGVDNKQMKDPTTMTKQERHNAAEQMIHRSIAERESGTVN